MPTALRSGSHLFRQVIDINLFLGCCESARFARIETDRDDVKLVTDLKRQHAKRSDHAVEHLRAEHRTVVVDEREHDGFATEELVRALLADRIHRERRDRVATADRVSVRSELPAKPTANLWLDFRAPAARHTAENSAPAAPAQTHDEKQRRKSAKTDTKKVHSDYICLPSRVISG